MSRNVQKTWYIIPPQIQPTSKPHELEKETLQWGEQIPLVSPSQVYTYVYKYFTTKPALTCQLTVTMVAGHGIFLFSL